MANAKAYVTVTAVKRADLSATATIARAAARETTIAANRATANATNTVHPCWVENCA
jgi:hypothetical protein